MSANALFHFTCNVDNLIDILSETFRPHYCLEDFRPLGDPSNQSLEIAVPMISFCDIPLFSIRTHINTYGHYGIGMTKEWGIRNHLSPVLYMYRGSDLRHNLVRILEYASNAPPLHPDHHPERYERAFDRLSSYVKPYEGSMWRGGTCMENIRFYDEREWRFVPSARSHNLPSSLTKAEFLDERYRESQNRLLRQFFRLDFQPNDIKYLILDNESEILSMIQAIEDIKGLYDPNTVKVLTTRIITVNQILTDF